MKIKLGYRGSDGMSEAVNIAARAAGINPFQMAWVGSHLFEAITLVVAKGTPVAIQGFGRFYTWYKMSKKGTGSTRAYPAFYAALPWRNEVAVCCPLVSQANIDYMNRGTKQYAKTHSLSPDAVVSSKRPMTAMDNVRAQIMAQARKNMADFRLAKTS